MAKETTLLSSTSSSATKVLLLLFVCHHASALKVMELMAPYTIQSVATAKYVTANEQGILGLRTGKVTTMPYKERDDQEWIMAWDPTTEEGHHGYRIESKKEYLNQITAYYPDEGTAAVPNIWEIVPVSAAVKQLKNKRTNKCLQVSRIKGDVSEKTCSTKNRFQHWRLEQIGLGR